MISNCLNPACQVPFSHAREGRIFSVERARTLPNLGQPDHQVEQYWLCGTCSQSLKVVIEDGRIRTAPIEVELTTLVG